jgi:hypothetical protein
MKLANRIPRLQVAFRILPNEYATTVLRLELPTGILGM